MITFGILALEAHFFLPDSLMCYRKINDSQAVCYPQSTPQIVNFNSDTPVEYDWEKESPPKHENWEDESRKQLAKFDTVPTTKESIQGINRLCSNCIYKHFPHEKLCYMFAVAPKGNYCGQFKIKE